MKTIKYIYRIKDGSFQKAEGNGFIMLFYCRMTN